MKIKTILIVAIVAFIAGFFLNDLVFNKPAKIKKVPVYLPSISKKTDTAKLPITIINVKLPRKNNKVQVDSTYYYKYLKEKDSVKQLSIFIDAIKVRDTTITLANNDTIKIDVWTKTRGKLVAQAANYTIKSRTIIVPVELPKASLMKVYGGLYATLPRSVELTPSIGIKLDLVSARTRSVISVGIDNRSTVVVGLSKKLF